MRYIMKIIIYCATKYEVYLSTFLIIVALI